MPTLTIKDGTEIYYKDWGTGQPIVFHHGWPLSCDDWDAQMMFFLMQGYRVVAHDRRGHGRSSQTTDGHDMDTYAADVFNYSPGHLSALFKQQVGDSIQQFIILHKLKLVATQLRQTPLTVSQIADEYGFSDVCHLNKLFKRYYHHTPTTYRQILSA